MMTLPPPPLSPRPWPGFTTSSTDLVSQITCFIYFSDDPENEPEYDAIEEDDDEHWG